MGSRRTNHHQKAQHAIGSMVERLVLPEMVQTHRALGLRPRLNCDLDAFIEQLLANNQQALFATIEDMRLAGHQLELIYNELLTPAARRLGEKWLRDEFSFSEVTLATWQIEQVLHHFHGQFESMRPTCASKASMLISLMPGEQHSLGAKMLRAFFSKAHWDVVLLQPKSLQAIIDELLVCQPNLISITVTQIESLDQIKNLIKLVRQQVSLRTTPWMIGGRVINDHLPQAQAVLTDRHIHFCQGDAKQALALANRLLGLDSTTQQSGSMGSTATQH